PDCVFLEDYESVCHAVPAYGKYKDDRLIALPNMFLFYSTTPSPSNLLYNKTTKALQTNCL
ncbi:hypothetical protein, partial [uncultured Muribaculum sp.]|uniref:hypothetical protein n=2 Tax=uncultured Muribaculum sp. TaxID=1918613 RepID=UPI0026747EFC